MIYYRSKFYNIILKSSKSFKMWEIYHLFSIILAIKSFPFINHVFEFLCFNCHWNLIKWQNLSVFFFKYISILKRK
jgi:hypothetical protein